MIKRQTLAMLLDSAPRSWSSIEELHYRLSKALIAQGGHVILVFSEPLPEKMASRFLDCGAQVETINYRKSEIAYFKGLRKLVHDNSITAVHISFFNYFDLIPWLVRLSGVHQIIYQEHNSGELRSSNWKKGLLRLRAGTAMSPVTTVVAISEFIRQQLIELGVPEEKIRLVRHGVDTQRFFPDAAARNELEERFIIKPDEVVVSSIAHMRPFKHPEVTVQACALLKKRGVKVRVFMAGGGEMRQELENLSRKLMVSDWIHWLGSVENPERLLQASDIFVLASVGEAFGLVLTEAMACGVPVVGSRSGAIPEIVLDGETGFLATPVDSVSFADAIERLSRDGKLRREMGMRGIERVRRYFTLGAFVKNMLEICEPVWEAGTEVGTSVRSRCRK